MMLEYLGFVAEAVKIEEAIARVYSSGNVLTPDQGGTATTTEFVAAVTQQL
jgi:isocitrate/isopropylmalate dehydrogenase